MITYIIGDITYYVGDKIWMEAGMLKPLLGSDTREKVLVFIFAREKGYAQEIADFFGIAPSQVQKQLDSLEAGGIVVGQPAGRTRLYQFNPRLFYLKELKPLLQKALLFYPAEIREKLSANRRRPRRRNKPL
jgi:predicted transcriptional regulator